MLRSPDFLTPLEAAVITVILDGLPTSGDCFRTQIQASQLISRKYTGYGFFTTVSVSADISSCSLLNAQLLAKALVDGQLCGFILWIKDGRIDCLEGYPLGGDSWPEYETFQQVENMRSS